jgi:hypothetical protein
MEAGTRRKLKWTEYVPQTLPTAADTTFYVCVLRDEDYDVSTLERDIRTAADTPDARIVSSYGGDVVELPWANRDKAYAVMTTILEAGCSLYTQTRMAVTVAPADLGPSKRLTPESLERITIRRTADAIENVARNRQARRFENSDEAMVNAITLIIAHYKTVYTHPSSWITSEGRDFVRYLRGYMFHNSDQAGSSSDEEVDTRAWEAPQTPVVLATERKRPIEAVEAAEDENLCLVCMDHVADTLVMPCMHQVACVGCSTKLRNTPNAAICIYCRGPVVSIEMDNKM